ncbi:hypothetical protein GN956_G22505 [Arapaima gigas]
MAWFSEGSGVVLVVFGRNSRSRISILDLVINIASKRRGRPLVSEAAVSSAAYCRSTVRNVFTQNRHGLRRSGPQGISSQDRCPSACPALL